MNGYFMGMCKQCGSFRVKDNRSIDITNFLAKYEAHQQNI
jgi:hypothetical protein